MGLLEEGDEVVLGCPAVAEDEDVDGEGFLVLGGGGGIF